MTDCEECMIHYEDNEWTHDTTIEIVEDFGYNDDTFAELTDGRGEQ